MSDASESNVWKELSVKDIKALLEAHNVSTADCFDKADLIGKAKAAGISPTQTIGTRTTTLQLAGLHCVALQNAVFTPQSPPDTAVILMHGYGADETDLQPIGKNILANLSGVQKRVVIIFPRAPLSLDGQGGRAWWPIDWQQLVMRAMAGQMDKILDEVPDGLLSAIEKVKELVNEVQTHYGVKLSRIILGGFSQGAILASQVGLSLPELPLGLCLFSAALYARTMLISHIQQHGSALRNLHILQSHGTQDMVLPYFVGDALRQLLQSFGATVDFISFQGPHTIPPDGLTKLSAMVKNL